MSCASKFASYVTMISYFFIVIINEFFTNPANVTQLNFFFFFTHNQIFVKVFLYYFFAVFILFKNCFNKFIRSIFTSKNNYRFSKQICKQNYKERNLDIFLSKNFHNFQNSLNYTQNQHKF